MGLYIALGRYIKVSNKSSPKIVNFKDLWIKPNCVIPKLILLKYILDNIIRACLLRVKYILIFKYFVLYYKMYTNNNTIPKMKIRCLDLILSKFTQGLYKYNFTKNIYLSINMNLTNVQLYINTVDV